MTVVQIDETFFRFQIHAFGAAAGGDILDFTTMLCEEPSARCVERWRDRTRDELRDEHKRHYVPSAWALPAARCALAIYDMKGDRVMAFQVES